MKDNDKCYKTIGQLELLNNSCNIELLKFFCCYAQVSILNQKPTFALNCPDFS